MNEVCPSLVTDISSDTSLIAACTKAVVANCVVLVPAAAVGAVGVPDKEGDADNTMLPVPVSSDITPANSVEVVAAKALILLVV